MHIRVAWIVWVASLTRARVTGNITLRYGIGNQVSLAIRAQSRPARRSTRFPFDHINIRNKCRTALAALLAVLHVVLHVVMLRMILLHNMCLIMLLMLRLLLRLLLM